MERSYKFEISQKNEEENIIKDNQFKRLEPGEISGTIFEIYKD